MIDRRGPIDEYAVPPGFVEPTFGQRLLARFVDAAVLLPVALLIGAVAEGRVRHRGIHDVAAGTIVTSLRRAAAAG